MFKKWLRRKEDSTEEIIETKLEGFDFVSPLTVEIHEKLRIEWEKALEKEKKTKEAIPLSDSSS